MHKRLRFQIILVLLIIATLVYHLSHYNEKDFKNVLYTSRKSFQKLLKNRISIDQVIIPKDVNTDLVQSDNKFTFDGGSSLTNKVKKSKYENHELTVYNDLNDIGLNLEKCNKIENHLRVGITDATSVDVSLVEILTQFLQQYQTNPYYGEIAPLFIQELKLQLKFGVVEHYWYRLAGSSVWLEQYQAHFMISRILYTPSGLRNQPLVSFTYGQLFDKDWHELTNTKIIVPTNLKEGAIEDNGKFFKEISFPYFLPIPFWHDYDDSKGRYYGPEDPRIILVNNDGYEEPLIIFNAYHRKFTHFDDDFDSKILLKSRFFRSIFICWPWKFQKGKYNTDGFSNDDFDNRLYNKVIELKIKNLGRQKNQKNWTPFLVSEEKNFIYFIYRWSNLEVLKCDLAHGTGICSFSYRLNRKLSTKAGVGPLRGGTQLININSILDKKFIPNNREIWIGFARAHLDKCGCGKDMYRPNLVVLTKDTLEGQNHYKIALISSSISFDVPMVAWDLLNPTSMCEAGSPNVLLPNGIGSWDVEVKDREVEDHLLLTLSISDFTVHRIYVKGLLSQLLSNNNQIFSDQPTLEQVQHDSHGFNNDNIVCGLKKATEFCKDYGLQVFYHQPEFSYIDYFKNLKESIKENFNVDQFIDYQENSDIDSYKHALYHQQLQSLE